MTAGETLLKISDYPFAYSFVAILSGLVGYSISQNHLLFLGVAGAFGTLLTFVDPIGIIIRRQQKYYFKTRPPYIEYSIKALSTRAINIEVDRIVGIIYFGITAGLFIVTLLYSNTFVDNLQIAEKGKSALCDSKCIQKFGIAGASIALVISVIFCALRWVRDLPIKVSIAGIHQLAISSDFPSINSVENMTQAVEQNDWITADGWGQKIVEEMNYKKGKKEIILRAGEKIYRPLHRETHSIINSLNTMNMMHSYRNLVVSLWADIILTADDIIIEDAGLREEIEDFYGDVAKYNSTSGTIRNIIHNIIFQKSSKEYGKNITGITCHVSVAGGNNDERPDLYDCAMFNLHPREFWGSGTLTYIEMTYLSNGIQQSEQIRDQPRIDAFDKIWASVLEDVKIERNILNFKDLITEIQRKGVALTQRYRDKVALEWKV